MKLRYENVSIQILYLFVFILFLIMCIIYVKADMPWDMVLIVSSSTLSVAFVYYLVYLYRVKTVQKYKRLGTRVQGYIVDSYSYKVNRKINYNLVFLCDGKLHIITKVSNNNAYKYLSNDLKEVYEYEKGVFKLKKYPIDVYVYGNKYSADIDSVNFN